MTSRPRCFVLMPFGKKTDWSGLLIDFDAVYRHVIKPAAIDAGLDPVRADEEVMAGIIHRPIFEALVSSPIVIADLTTTNANVMYELGIRHTAARSATILLAAQGGRIPFDIAMLPVIMYALSDDGTPANAVGVRRIITETIARAVTEGRIDSPVHQLLNLEVRVAEISPVVESTVDKTAELRQSIASARQLRSREALEEVERRLRESTSVDDAVAMDLFLAYRDFSSWERVIEIVDVMSTQLRSSIPVQQQLALALNRTGQSAEAERVLNELLSTRGPSSETYGILGRIYKDRWEMATGTQDPEAARWLDLAITAYLNGFEADWRDAYPGVNAVTLMSLRHPLDPRRDELIPVVRYAVKRRLASGKPDYWDFATLLELAVIARDERGAYDALDQATSLARAPWETQTTVRNLRLFQKRANGGDNVPPWIPAIIRKLEEHHA